MSVLLFAGLSRGHSEMRLGRRYCCASVSAMSLSGSPRSWSLWAAQQWLELRGRGATQGCRLECGVESGARENVFGFSYGASFKQLWLYWTRVRLTADGTEEQQRDGGLRAGVMNKTATTS